MFNVGGGEILVILLVALLVLGPNKLPDAARQAGQAFAQVRRLSNSFQRELREAMEDTDHKADDPGPRLPPAGETGKAEAPAPEPPLDSSTNGGNESRLPPQPPRATS
jgi:sec-independent protein translocase protein TatB